MRSIIYNDLNDSDYTFQYNNLTFYFSSRFYLEKFKNSFIEFLKTENDKLNIKFMGKIKCDEMILILLYKKIEKRGFKILKNGKELNNYLYSIDIIE